MDEGSSYTKWHEKIGPRDPWAQKKANAFYGVLILGMFGAVCCGLLAAQLAPTWLVEIGFVGFVAGAAAYAFVDEVFRKRSATDEFSGGNSRTEEEVRQALADIRARKK